MRSKSAAGLGQCDGLLPTILNQRLKELRDAGIVILGNRDYVLIGLDRDLFAAPAPLH